MATFYVRTSSAGGDGTTDTDSGANAAFASLSACEIALRATDWSGQTVTIECSCGSGTAADTTIVQFLPANWTNPKPVEIIINFNGPTQSYWEPTQYRMEATSGPILRCSIACNFTINRPRIKANTTNNATEWIRLGVAGTVHYTFRVADGIVWQPSVTNAVTAGTCVSIASDASTSYGHFYVTNMFCIGSIRGINQAFPIFSSGTVVIDNCTSVSQYNVGIRLNPTSNNATRRLRNNISQGTPITCYVAATATNTVMSGNISQDATSPDTAGRNITLTFTNLAGQDCALTDTNADFGSDLSADSINPFSTDIMGSTRVAWYSGAYEPIGGGGTVYECTLTVDSSNGVINLSALIANTNVSAISTHTITDTAKLTVSHALGVSSQVTITDTAKLVISPVLTTSSQITATDGAAPSYLRNLSTASQQTVTFNANVVYNSALIVNTTALMEDTQLAQYLHNINVGTQHAVVTSSQLIANSAMGTASTASASMSRGGGTQYDNGVLVTTQQSVAISSIARFSSTLGITHEVLLTLTATCRFNGVLPVASGVVVGYGTSQAPQYVLSVGSITISSLLGMDIDISE